MAEPALRPGKLPVALLRRLLGRGDWPPELLLPPGIGEDAAVLAVPAGALVAATDPITLTGANVGAHAAIINANDVAVTGARPRWFLATVLMPVGTTAGDLRRLFEGLYAALDRLGATLIGGHTEITDAVSQAVVVGQMLGLREDGGFVRTGGVRPGDVILQIGPAPIEGAAVLAQEAARRLVGLPPDVVARALAALEQPGVAVVDPALASAALGATALHDPTEGGLSAGLYELAEASSVVIQVDADAVLWFAPGVAVCRAVGADPWGVLASGTLLASFPEERFMHAELALQERGHPVAAIARADAGQGVVRTDGAVLPRYEQDELSRVLADRRRQDPGT